MCPSLDTFAKEFVAVPMVADGRISRAIWLGEAAGAADLKFLHHLQQTRLGTSNRKRHENHRVASAPWFPKFVSERAEVDHELRKRGTRACRLPCPFWPRSGIAPALI